jgi:hypothetical protein
MLLVHDLTSFVGSAQGAEVSSQQRLAEWKTVKDAATVSWWISTSRDLSRKMAS